MRKITALLTSMTLACSLLAGCEGGSQSTPSTTAALQETAQTQGKDMESASDPQAISEEPLPLTLMSVDSTADSFGDWIKRVEKACNLEITVVDCPTNTNDRQAKITTILSSGDTSVDLITVNDEMYTAYKNTGWLEPLQDTVMVPDILAQYPEIYMKDMVITQDGGIYSVPSYFSVLGFFVNNRILKETGMESVETYDDFIEFVTKATGNGRYGYGGAWETTYVFNEIGTFVNLFGGDYFDWTNPNTQKAVKLLYDMSHDMGVTPLAQMADQYDPLRQNMIDESRACCFLYSGQIAKFKGADMYGDDKIKMVVPPAFETSSAYCSAWHFVLNSASKNKEAAIRFLQYSTTREACEDYCTTFGRFPARLDVLMDENFNVTGIDEMRAYTEKVILRGRPMVPESMEYISGIGSLFQQLVTDEIDLDTFFVRAQEETDKYER